MVFDQIKKIAELKKLQDSFKRESITVEKRGVTVIMNGSMEIEEVKLNPELNIDEQQTVLKQCLNEAKADMQKKLAKIMMGSGLSF